MLTPEMREQYEREGYTIAPGFFAPDEVAVIRDELQRFVDDGKIDNVSTAGDGETQDAKAPNLQLIPLSAQSDVYRALPFAKKVRESVRALIGEDFVLQLDQIFLKPARHGAGTNWHQDNAYFQIEDPRQGVGVWVAVHDATVTNGTMHIVPGSHEKAYPHERDPNSNHHICCQVDETRETVLPVEMKAGGALFFNYGIVHCTKGNQTESPRAGLAMHFLCGKYARRGVGGKATKPWLSGPEYTGGEAEWGTRQEGRWEAMLTRSEAVAR